MQKKYKVKNNKMRLNFILIFCITLSTCLLSIGYAELVATNLNINVKVSANMQEGMFISDVKLLTNNGADLSNSQIDYTGQVLHPNIYLTDGSSSITYEVTIYNNSDSAKVFTGIEYVDDYYSNDEIGYRLDGLIAEEKNGEGVILVQGSHLHKGESITFNITFYYKNPSNVTEHKLDAYLKFGFDYYFDEVGDMDIILDGEGTYEFAGVGSGPGEQVNINNLANINFIVANSTGKAMTGILVNIKYNKSSGSAASTEIHVYNASGIEIIGVNDRTVLFDNKNGTNKEWSKTLNFTETVSDGSSFNVKFDKPASNNGKLDVIGLTITPVY